MKPILVLTLLFAFLAGTTPARSQDQPTSRPATQPVDPSPQAVALLRQLDDADYSRREQAEQELLAMAQSEPALEGWLEAVSRGDVSPEVRSRAKSILAKLAEHRLLGATLITMDLQQVHPREVLAELSRQSGVRFEYWPQDPWEQGGAGDGKVSLQIEDAPFWEALRRVSEMTGLVPVEHQTPSAGAIVLSRQGEPVDVSPTMYHGAFAVQLRRIYRGQTAQVELGVGPDGKIGGNTNSDRSLNMEMRLLVEPKIRLTGGVSQPTLEVAVDEAGHSLLLNEDPRFGGRQGWSSGQNTWSVQSSIALDAKAAAQSRAIARLSGRIEAEIATEMERLEVNLEDLVELRRLQDGQKQSISKHYKVGPFQIEFTSIQRSGEQALEVEMDLRWERQQGEADQQEAWIRIQALSNALQLQDDSGRFWASGGSGSGWDSNTGVARVSRSFHRSGENLGRPARLVLEVPTQVMTVIIPFEFTDVPLPTWE